ncbi:MAG: PfkB family carbohydrate kinase [Planctomycetota bacterium]|nr:PfkB family carbohydrate kinase [Planctomycetota bacterium]MDA1142627.1 PfkB family carbohydrate kinase [Planctomycetota bacterium]
MIDILCIGHVAWDVFLPLKKFPEEDSKAVIHEWSESGGGPASNAAYLLTRWGAQTAFAGVVGGDANGYRIIDEFKAAGTDTSLIQIDEKVPTPHSTIIVNEQNGSRTILNRRKEKAPCVLGPSADEMRPKVILLDGHELDASLDAIERFPDAQTVLDAGALREATRVLAGKVDYLLASKRFTEELTGVDQLDNPDQWRRALRGLHETGCETAAFTLGAKGLVYELENECVHLPAFKVKAVDTTAAGDIFHGAFAFGLLQKMGLVQCLIFSSMAAALSVERPGGRNSIPALQEVEAALSRRELPS